MLRAMISILLLIILAVGTVLLEIYLAKKPSRWPGLVLPFMFFLFSFSSEAERALPQALGFTPYAALPPLQ